MYNRDQNSQSQEGQPIRVKIPRGREILGVVEQRVGGSRMIVKCFDGIARNCRVPGRLKRALWVREGDIVIVEPWEFDKEKGDVLFKYNPTQVEWLKKRGFMEKVKEL